MVQEVCNKIESNIASFRVCLETGGENKNTKWENSGDRCGCMVLNNKKHLLESGEISTM